jgi:hypothetical protein
MFDYKAFARALCHRRRYIRETARPAAACAGEVWVALGFGAVAGKLKMPRSLMGVGLMYQFRLAEVFQGAIDSNLIDSGFF